MWKVCLQPFWNNWISMLKISLLLEIYKLVTGGQCKCKILSSIEVVTDNLFFENLFLHFLCFLFFFIYISFFPFWFDCYLLITTTKKYFITSYLHHHHHNIKVKNIIAYNYKHPLAASLKQRQCCLKVAWRRGQHQT